MANFVVNKSIDNVIDGVAFYLKKFTKCPIIRGNANRAAMPQAPFIVLTEILTSAVTKPIEIYGDKTVTVSEQTQIDVQVDFYGWDLSDTAIAVKASIRTVWSTDNFPPWLIPLYCGDIVKTPLTNGEEQYEQRWFFTLSLQYNPVMTLPQLSFNVVGDINSNPIF